MKKLILFSILFSFTCSVYSQVTVQGFAFLENQTNFDSIKILFVRTAPSSLTDSTYTNSSGHYSKSLQTGIYNVTYSKINYFYLTLSGKSFYSNTTLTDTTILAHRTLINVPQLFPTIQEAINQSFNFDTVLVGTGTYYENINFNSKKITVASNFLLTGDTSYISQTIINGSNNGTVVKFDNYEDSTSVICGFKITNGHDDFSNGGGGIFCSSSPKISYLFITANTAESGGGIYCTGQPIIRNSKISNNNCIGSNPFGQGGGICANSTIIKIYDSDIFNNTSSVEGGGLYGAFELYNVNVYGNTASRGGGLSGSIVKANNLLIDDNHVTNQGGGVLGSISRDVKNIIISNNSGNVGGAIMCSGNILRNILITNNHSNGNGLIYWTGDTISNVIVSNNESDDNQGIVYCVGPKAHILNTTICANKTGTNGASIYIHSNINQSEITNTIVSNTKIGYGIYSQGANQPIISNCDVFDNQSANFYNCGSFVGINVSINANGDSIDPYNNIQLDPMFVDTANGDYHMLAGSHCIDVGINNSVSIPSDFEGNIRIWDGDGNGSAIVDMGAFEFGSHPPVILSLIYTNVTCHGGSDGIASVTPTNGSPPFNYQWDNIGGTTDSIATGLYANIYYHVTVTDTYFVTAIDSVILSEPAAITANLNVTICQGNYYSFNGHTYTATGIYNDTLHMINSCDSIIITNLTVNQLTLNIATSSASCGQQNGNATVTVNGGTPPYHFAWTSGDTLATADSLAAGMYMLTITDVVGCNASALASVSNANGPVITVDSVINLSCFESNNGAINISVTGGTEPYTFLWTTGAITEDISNLVVGPYEIEIIDSLGCMTTASYFVSQPDELSAVATCTPATCGYINGAATITVTGGVQPYTFSWSNGIITQQSDSLAPGVYTITITDSNACSASPLMVSINTVNGPVVIIDSILQTGCSGTDGAIYVSVSGGNQPYIYNWSDTSSVQDITQLSAGNYQLTVTDSLGCIGTIATTISHTQPFVPQICMVSVDSIEHKNLIVWEKEITANIDHYNIYREGSWAGYYFLAGSKSYSSMSTFIDINSNPQMRAYRYKITAVDNCGNESDASIPHKTIHLAINDGIGNAWNLIWTEYEGFNFPGYYIYRFTNSLGWSLIDSIATGYNSYTDVPSNQGQINYMVTINSPQICNPIGAKEMTGPFSQSLSNIEDNGIIEPVNVLQTKSDELNCKIYPNPTNDKFTIEMTKNGIAEIIDLQGRIIKTVNLQNVKTTIDLQDCYSGIYSIRIITDKEIIVRKLIKQ